MVTGMHIRAKSAVEDILGDVAAFMISVFIIMFSVIAALQFGLGYCRSMVACFADYGVSSRTRELGALTEGAMRGEDFGKLVSLIRVCPHKENDGRQILFVRMYFAMLGAIGRLGGMSQSVARWTAGERGHCSYAVAVLLDRRVLASIPPSR
jgi:hypothetical protein